MTYLPPGYNPSDLPGQIIDEGWSGRIVDPISGAGLFNANTDYNVVGVDPLTGELSPIGTDVGFGASVRRWIQAGVYNGDFAVPPAAPQSVIVDAYNMLPYWSFQPTQSGQIVAFVEQQSDAGFEPTAFYGGAFSASTSGVPGVHQLRLQMFGGGYTEDDAYLTQLVPVTTTADEVYELQAGFSLIKVPDLDSSALAYLTVTFYQGNLLASTASPNSVTVTKALTADSKDTVRTSAIAIPDDAAYARVSIGLRRNTTDTTTTAECCISEVFLTQQERVIARDLKPAIDSTYTVGTTALRWLKTWTDTIDVGGFAFTGAGSAFPGAPTSGDHFYRTDIRGGMLFRWDGTYWLSEQEYSLDFEGEDIAAPGTAIVQRYALPSDLQVYVQHVSGRSYVATTNNGSNWWTFTLYSGDASDTYTNRSSAGTSAGSVDTWIALTFATAAPPFLLDTTDVVLRVAASVSGSPGISYPKVHLTYRLRAT
jgi:hypothetical protein